jgi:aryl-alcohol dehydrogenase-like predicted oxidoreductase
MRLPQTGGAFDPDSPPRDRAQAISVLRAAVELGVNHIDTAAFYFSATRSANELINSALAPYPADLVIATKVGPVRTPDGGWLDPATPQQLRGQVEENLRQLGRDHLDLVYFRCAGQDTVAEYVSALADLQRAGLIRHLGLSAIKPTHLAEAQAVAPIVAVQNSYGLGYRRTLDGLVRLCADQDIAFVPFFSIAGANREAGATTENDTVKTVAAANNVSIAQVRLAWALRRGPHVLVIPGTGDPHHLADNVAADSLDLTADEWDLLDSV